MHGRERANRHDRRRRRTPSVLLALVAVVVIAAACDPAESTSNASTTASRPEPSRLDVLAGATSGSPADSTSIARVRSAPELGPFTGLGAGLGTAALRVRGGRILYLAGVTGGDGELAPVRIELRLLGSDGGARSLIGSATSFAVDRNGRLAYTRPIEDPTGSSDRAHVVVRDGLHGDDQTWLTTPGRYEVLAWADRYLVAHREVDSLSDAATLVISGPGEARELAPSTTVVAVAPRGDALLTTDLGAATTLSIVDLDDLASRAVPLPDEVNYILSAAWVGASILLVVAWGADYEHALVRLSPGRSSEAQVWVLDGYAQVGAPFLWDATSVGVLETSTEVTDGQITSSVRVAAIRCAASAESCERHAAGTADASSTVARVFNPSRPSRSPLIEQ